jgi:flagellar biosynthesis protein FlhG
VTTSISMKDQATTLRNIATLPMSDSFAGYENNFNGKTIKSRTIAITGGKGGIGKSNVAVNLSMELAALGRKVSLLDADFGLANADVLLGFNPQHHLGHVLTGQRQLNEIILEHNSGVRLIPGGSGIEHLANLSQTAHTRCVAELRAMEVRSDYMVIDTAAGIAGNVTGVLKAASEVVVVTTTEPTSVVDAYATIKVLHHHAPQKPIWILVNNASGTGDSQQVFSHLYSASQRFLSHYIEHLGTIPHDSELERAVRERTPVVVFAPNSSSSRAFRVIAKILDQHKPAASASEMKKNSFWENLTDIEV